jgi:uncharacterized membrane protein YccC
LQYGLAFGIATALVAIRVVREEVFRDRAIDVPIVVAATWVPTVGETNWRAVLRIAGVAVGSVWSYALLGLSFAATGGTWSDTPGKFLVAAGMTAIWLGSTTMCVQRYGQYSIMWFVAAITVAIVALPSLRTPDPGWNNVAFRAINETIGVAILWLVAIVILPVSARHVASANLADGLEKLAALARSLPTQASTSFCFK